MRARLITAAAAIAVATPALAADLYAPTYVPPSSSPVYKPTPMVVGHLMVGIGFIDDWDGIQNIDLSNSVGVFVGAGRANIPFGGSWNFELETGGASLFDNGFSYSSIGVAGHVWTKLNSAAVGIYGGVNFPTGATIYTLGLEGEVYFGNFTFGGDADYNWTDGAASGNDFWTGSLWADAYLNPNWRIGGEFEYYGSPLDTWLASLDTEYRFGGPISGWAKVAYADGPSAWSGLLGIRVFMDGGNTLIGHDREVPWESGLIGPDQLGP